MSWNNVDDIEKDILLYAEITTKPPKKSRTPEALRRYRDITESNARIVNGLVDSNMTCVISGRGRGIKDRILSPGQNFEVLPSDEQDLKKQIREVCGLGYSNSLIEQSFKRKSPQQSVEVPKENNTGSPQLTWVVEKPKTSPRSKSNTPREEKQ